MKIAIRLMSLLMALVLCSVCILTGTQMANALTLQTEPDVWLEAGRSIVFCNFTRSATCSQIKSLFSDTGLSVYSPDGTAYADTEYSGTGSVVRNQDSSEELTVVLFGDINGDGVVDALDAMLVELAGSGNLELTGAGREAADLTRDGCITDADVGQVCDLSVGLESDIGLKSQSSHTIAFLDWDGTVLDSQTVADNGSADLPSPPDRDGYIFTGWSGKLTKVSSNNTVTAAYIPSSEENVFCLSSASASAGDTVTLTLTLTGTVYMCGYQLEVAYDPDCLTYVSNTRGSSVMTNHIASSHVIRASYVNMSAVNESAARTVLTVKFTVNSTTADKTPVTVNLNKIFDGNESIVAGCAVSGTVYIK